MPNWRKIIVGDAFKLPSRDLNYYRDLVLVWPFTLFSIVSAIRGTGPSHSPADTVYFHRGLAVALICLLLAKERLLLVGISLGLLVCRGLLPMMWAKDWVDVLWLMLGVVAFLSVTVLKMRAGWRLSYEIPEGFTVLGMIIGVSSLVASLTLAQWMLNWPN